MVRYILCVACSKRWERSAQVAQPDLDGYTAQIVYGHLRGPGASQCDTCGLELRPDALVACASCYRQDERDFVNVNWAQDYLADREQALELLKRAEEATDV